MRAGSGAVLLVGFALVVMLLSVAGALTSPVIGMKQDPSQDFADVAASIRQITYACGNFGGNDTDRYEYYEATLKTLSEKLREKGILLNYTPIVYWDVCTVIYSLQSSDSSTYVEGAVSTDISLENALRSSLHGGGQGGYGFPVPLVTIPSALCLNDRGAPPSNMHVGLGDLRVDIYPNGDVCFKVKDKRKCLSSELGVYYLIFNLNPTGLDAKLSYEGDDALQNWYVYNISLDLSSFPPLDIDKVKDYDNNGDIEFYLDTSRYQTVNLLLWKLKLPKGVGIGYVKINHTSGKSGPVDALIATAPGYSPKRIPIYWNECPLSLGKMWKELMMLRKSLRSGG